MLGNFLGLYFDTGKQKEKKDCNLSGSFQSVTGYELFQKWQRRPKPGCCGHKHYAGNDFPDRSGLAKALGQFTKNPSNNQQCKQIN